MAGQFKKNSIVVDLEITSPVSDKIKHTFPVVVDTGFTNDLCLTYQEAFPLALTLVGIQEFTIADGTRVPFFECLGVVKLGNKSVMSTISIRPNGTRLMGISLLKKFGCTLNIDFISDSVEIKPRTLNKKRITASKEAKSKS